MYIPQAFRKILKNNALILVASRQDARFLKLEKHRLEEIERLHIETPRYSDHEEHFEARGKNGIWKAGSSIERPNVEAFYEFLKEMEVKLAELIKIDQISEVVICAPLNVKNALFEILPKKLEDKVSLYVSGNLIKTPPLKILDRICQWLKRTETTPHSSPEALKILKLARP